MKLVLVLQADLCWTHADNCWMVDVKSLNFRKTCVFSLSFVLGMCSYNLSMELSRTFLFSYLSFCDCHLLLSVFDCHLQ